MAWSPLQKEHMVTIILLLLISLFFIQLYYINLSIYSMYHKRAEFHMESIMKEY